MSDHKVEVVRIDTLLPHPNADVLELAPIWGYQCCVKKGDFKLGDLAIYIPPDYVVPTNHPLFAWLKDSTKENVRIKVRRLRGIYSQGLLVPAPDGCILGENVMARFGITRYEPPVAFEHGEAEPGPQGFGVFYDVEAFERYAHLYSRDEDVLVTEKIHGANGRFVYWNNHWYCGSRREWKGGDSVWRRAGEAVREFCQAYPGVLVFGEVYGDVQDLHYGCGKGEVRLTVFDVWQNGQFWAQAEARRRWPFLPWVPVLMEGRLSVEQLKDMATGPTHLTGGHLREGIVITPAVERVHSEFPKGRVQWKLINPEYLARD